MSNQIPVTEERYKSMWDSHIGQLHRLPDYRDDKQVEEVRVMVNRLKEIVAENVASGYYKS